MRTALASMTCLRKPAKLPGPALPVSIQVVTPLFRQNASASMPSDVPPQYTCVWRSIRPGATRWPDTSRTSVPASPARSGPILATLPAAKAMSAVRSRLWDGSIIRPPFRIRSNVIRRSIRQPRRTLTLRAAHEDVAHAPAGGVRELHAPDFAHRRQDPRRHDGRAEIARPERGVERLRKRGGSNHAGQSRGDDDLAHDIFPCAGGILTPIAIGREKHSRGASPGNWRMSKSNALTVGWAKAQNTARDLTVHAAGTRRKSGAAERISLSHRENEQPGKFQHHLAVGTCRIGVPDFIGVVCGEFLAHRRVERRKEWSQPRALEPFDHARVVLDDVIV